MGKRLGLALGTNSIGWAILETNEDGPANIVPTNILNAGVRIFSDGRNPHNGDPLAVQRRRARGARVRRDRLIRRKSDLRKALTGLGLFPADKSEQESLKSFNPYELRVRALTEKLNPHELGRALIHLSQRRGFQTNRKGNQKEEEKKDRAALDHALKESGLTLGQYLYQRLKEGKGTRARPGEGLTTLRDHYKHEFARIREAQKPHHALSGDDWEKIQHILFFQRDMKPAHRGYCQIYFKDKEQRAARAMPSFQRFRIEKNLVNLRIIGPDSRENHLTPDQRAKLRERLLSQKTMGFGKIRTLLGLDESHSFNLETDRRKDFEGDATGALMMKKDYFGKAWNSFDLEQQDNIVTRLLEEGSPETLKAVAREEWHLPDHRAQALIDLDIAKLETGTVRFSRRALYELIPILSERGLSVSEASARICAPRIRGLAEPELNYYGQILPDSVVPQPRATVEDERLYGKINNPTVHIGLNQLRKLINEIIAGDGLPDEIVVELSLDLTLSRDAKKNLASKQKDNQELVEQPADHTHYLCELTGHYLESLYPDDDKIHVQVIPGRLTAKLRHQWGLNSILSVDGTNEQNPSDYRHHAIDAVVIACTDQSLLLLPAATQAAPQEPQCAPPFGTTEEFRARVKTRVDPVIVSHRPDHGYQGALHETTNYGIIENPNTYEAANNYNVVYRKPFVSLFAGLQPEKARDKAAEIRDARLRHSLINLLKGASSSEDVARIVEAFAKDKGIRHIRLLKKETTIIPIEHPASCKRFKKGVVPGKINHVGFWQMPSGDIKAVAKSAFEVNQARGDMNKLKPHPAAKLKMILHKKDMVRLVKSGRMLTCTVVTLSPLTGTGTFKLRPHNLPKSQEFTVSFTQVRNYQVRKISITSSGQLHDPGPIF
jgi:hypothetical protein